MNPLGQDRELYNQGATVAPGYTDSCPFLFASMASVSSTGDYSTAPLHPVFPCSNFLAKVRWSDRPCLLFYRSPCHLGTHLCTMFLGSPTISQGGCCFPAIAPHMASRSSASTNQFAAALFYSHFGTENHSACSVRLPIGDVCKPQVNTYAQALSVAAKLGAYLSSLELTND
jgi:hypothetical protein